MQWVKPKPISLNNLNKAGVILTKLPDISIDDEEIFDALDILDNWRAVHSYPMHVFKKRLREKALGRDDNALTVQRLKRVPAILAKLDRSYDGKKPTMNLSQMQDIGGCRTVLSSVELVRKVRDDFVKGHIKHKKVGEKDYISNPKPDGYRSIHLVYRFFSDKGKSEYNGLLIEIQLRSRLQHLWATAIETVDFFARQAIKSNEGEKEWMDFFKLVSSAFAQMEGCPPVPDIPKDEKELYSQIKEKEAQLNVIKIMNKWAEAVKIFENTKKTAKRYHYFLLELDILKENLNISVFTKNQEKKAIERYSEIEKKNIGKKEFDVVLVGAENLNELKKAYPNYFVDTSEFLNKLKIIINKYES